MDLEVRELDQLVHVLAIATVMLALMAIGLYGTDLSYRWRQEALAKPKPQHLAEPPSREDLLRAMVRDLR